MRAQLERANDEKRAELFTLWGGTTTPRRRLWRQQIERARRNGYYRQYIGEVDELKAGPNDTVVTRMRSRDGSVLEVEANFIIDCTGLEGDVEQNRILADLFEHSSAGKNVLGKLDCSPSFEVRGTASTPGRMYASGSITLGSYYAVVDSFQGLQYAALRIVDDLARHGFGRRMGVGRSVSQWFRWAMNRPVGTGS